MSREQKAIALLLKTSYAISRELHELEAAGIEFSQSMDKAWANLTVAIERAQEESEQKAEGQAAQQDEARELLRDSLPFLRAANFIYFAAPRDRLVAKINAFLQREGAQKAEGQNVTRSIGSNTPRGSAPSAPEYSEKQLTGYAAELAELTAAKPAHILMRHCHIAAQKIDQLERELAAAKQENYELAVVLGHPPAAQSAMAAIYEECAITAWNTGMNEHDKLLGMPADAREVGSACARAIRDAEKRAALASRNDSGAIDGRNDGHS